MLEASETPADVQEYETLCPNDFTPMAEQMFDSATGSPEVLFVCPICEFQTVQVFDAPVEID